jgi:alpha-1,3-rhamnosyl/mannosyltransferase
MRDSERLTVGLSWNVVDPAFTTDGIDGIGIYTRALDAGLREMDTEVRRIGAPVRRGRKFRQPSAADVTLPIPLPAALGFAAIANRYLPFKDRIESAVDVYHATDYLVPRLERKAVVATLYDAIPLAHPEWANRRLRPIKNWLLRAAAENADRVIAISRAAVGELVEHYRIPDARIRVVPLGIDARWFVPPGDAALSRSHPGLAERTGFFLAVGTLQPRKNIAALLAAYDRLPEPMRRERQLVVVGKFGWGVRSLRLELVARRAAGRVVWLEYVDDAVLRALYANAGALVFPSLAEGFGLPVLEAFAAGCPVIASDLPALREVAGALASFFPAGDVEALADAMRATAGAPRDASLAAARRAHAARFTWRECCRRTLAVYREVA